jgi:hypothetical protein
VTNAAGRLAFEARQEFVGAGVELGDVTTEAGGVRPQTLEVFGIAAKPVMLGFDLVELGPETRE